MFKFVSTLGLLTTLLAGTATAQQTVTLLDRGEPYDAMIADGGALWIGQSRHNFNVDYHLEAYNPDGRLLDRVALPHSLSVLKSFGDGAVIVTGINPDSRLTEYTVAKLVDGHIRVSTSTIALGGFITFWVGDLAGRHYFVDQGGNPNDTDITSPAQTLFYTTRSTPRYLSTRVRMPVSGGILDGKIYLVSSEGIGSSAGKIVEVDPSTLASRVVYQSRTAGMTVFEPILQTRLIATNARLENKLLVLDRQSGAITREFPTNGYTRSVVSFGHCVIAGNDETNTIQVFDLNQEGQEASFEASVTLPAEEFSGIKRIVIDQGTGMLFARAALACNPVIEACDKDNNRVVTFGLDVAAKIRGLCR